MKKKILLSLSIISILLVSLLAQAAFAGTSGDSFAAENFTKTGSNITLTSVSAGVRFTHNSGSHGFERAMYQPHLLVKEGISVDITDISSAESKYSIAFMIGNEQFLWSDKRGYMVVCGNDGSLAVYDCNESVPNIANHSPVAQGSFSASDSLNIDIKLIYGQYVFTVNETSVVVPAKHGAYPMINTDDVYIAFGGMVGTPLNGLTPAQLFSSSLSFTVAKPKRSVTVTEREIDPFSKYEAIMSVSDLEASSYLTRGEAIDIIAGLIADRSDYAGVNTSDFSDVLTSHKYYASIAYMGRCGYLSTFGTTLSPDSPISGTQLNAVITSVFGNGKVTISETSASITRARAAEIFCNLVGKSVSGGDYVRAATTETPVTRKEYPVAVGDNIQTKIDEAISESQTMSTPLIATIKLSSGTHRLTSPIVIDGGAYGENLVIIISSTENAVVTSNQDILSSVFEKVSGKNYYKYQLPSNFKIGGEWRKFRDIYLNGERLTLARSNEYVFEKGLQSGDSGYENKYYVDGEFIKETELAPMELCFNMKWCSKIMRLDKKLGTESGYAAVSVMQSDHDAFNIFDGNKTDGLGCTYWLENHISLLDKEGEFFYDDVNGIIYFVPFKDTDMNSSTVSIPFLSNLFELNEAHDVVFDGVTFTGTTCNFASDYGYNGGLGGTHLNYYIWSELGIAGYLPSAAIYGEYTEDIRILNCAFDSLGGNGIYIDGYNKDITVKGNSFADLAASGILLGRTSYEWSGVNGQLNVIIDNNYIYSVGTDYMGSPGIGVAQNKNTFITHNTVIHTPYSAIMVGGLPNADELGSDINTMNSEIAYNRCEDNMYALEDGTGIYISGANAARTNKTLFNKIHDNYIKGNAYKGVYNGIYLDASASNWHVYNNVVDGIVSSHSPIFNQDHVSSQYTYNNTVEYNYSTYSKIDTTADSSFFNARNVIVKNNTYCASYDKLPEAALNVIAASGQQSSYSGLISQNGSIVVMNVEESHVNIQQQYNPDVVYATFTVTNNTRKVQTYNVKDRNGTSVAEVMAEPLTLQSGEVGTIRVELKGTGGKGANEVYDFTVYSETSGWSMDFRRAIEITVGDTMYHGTDINVKYEDIPIETVMSVDIYWENLQFTYTEASRGTWNENELKYENPMPASWKNNVEGGDNTADIKVVNKSNIAVKVDVAFKNLDGYKDVVGGFSYDENKCAEYDARTKVLSSAEPEEYEAKGKATYVTATFEISGSLPIDHPTDKYVNIGIITVTLSNEEVNE